MNLRQAKAKLKKIAGNKYHLAKVTIQQHSNSEVEIIRGLYIENLARGTIESRKSFNDCFEKLETAEREGEEAKDDNNNLPKV